MLMTPTTRRAEVKTPSRLPPPKEIGSAACVHGAFAGRATRGFVISRLGRLRRSYHHPLQTAFPCQWLVSALVGPPIACSYRGRTVVLKVKVSPDLIAGDVDEGYGKVADVFRRNLTSGQEVGAAVAVYRDGVKVVDLWGGFRNGITKAPWEKDTLVPTFSTTKGVSSLAVAVAASQGLISYDAKVADYWPEFAQASKDRITVRELLSHQAGLPVIDPPLTLQQLAGPHDDVGSGRGAGTRMGSWDQTRLPRDHPRVVRIGTCSACRSRRAVSWPVFRRGGCETAWLGVLHRIARLGGPQPGGAPARLVRTPS